MEYGDRKETSGSPEVVELGGPGDLPPEKAGTVYDQKDMERVGKKQELRVCIPWSLYVCSPRGKVLTL